MESSEKIWKTGYNHPSAWEQTFPPLSMVEMVANSAAANPQAVMIDFMGRKTSYGEMLHSIRRVARGLQDLGIRKGDRVGLFACGSGSAGEGFADFGRFEYVVASQIGAAPWSE